MAAGKPTGAHDERRGQTLGERLRASEAFADLREYVQTGAEAGVETSGEAGSETGAEAGEPPEQQPPRGRRTAPVVVASALVATALIGVTAGYLALGPGGPGEGNWGRLDRPAHAPPSATAAGRESRPIPSTSASGTPAAPGADAGTAPPATSAPPENRGEPPVGTTPRPAPTTTTAKPSTPASSPTPSRKPTKPRPSKSPKDVHPHGHPPGWSVSGH